MDKHSHCKLPYVPMTQLAILKTRNVTSRLICTLFSEFVLNPVGKTPLCILHEYVQHVLRVQPEYIFKELGKTTRILDKTCVHFDCSALRLGSISLVIRGENFPSTK